MNTHILKDIFYPHQTRVSTTHRNFPLHFILTAFLNYEHEPGGSPSGLEDKRPGYGEQPIDRLTASNDCWVGCFLEEKACRPHIQYVLLQRRRAMLEFAKIPPTTSNLEV